MAEGESNFISLGDNPASASVSSAGPSSTRRAAGLPRPDAMMYVIKTHSIKEAVEILGAPSERWLVEQLRTGRFPGYKVGRRWRMTDKDLQDALKACANDVRRTTGNAVAPVSGLTRTSRRNLHALRMPGEHSAQMHRGGTGYVS